MKSLIRLSFCSFMLTAPLLAQQAPNNALGFQPAKSFPMGDYDTVNLFNGNLTVALPIGPSYTPGGSLAYGLHLIYNGNAWVIQGETPPEAIPNRFSNAGLGWKMTLGELVAPHDPAILDISNGGNWVYVAADGSEHTFYTTLHQEENGTGYAGSDSLDQNTVVGYTRDGSYLRLRRGTRFVTSTHSCQTLTGLCHDYTVTYSIESPDGNVHSFEAQVSKDVIDGQPTLKEDAKLSYRLISIVDRFGNYLHVTYSADGLTWTLKDGTTLAGDIRTHTLHFINQTFYEYSGQSTAHLFVSSIDLSAFNGQAATYQFNYGDYESISKNCDDQYSGVTTKTRFLNSVTQPDGSTFGLTYNKIEHNTAGVTTCSSAAGHLLKLTLPTGGSIQYTLGQRRFPTYPDELEKGIPGTWRDHSASVETRTLVDANNATAGTWTYHADLTDPAFFHHPPNDTTELEKQGLAITVKDPLQRTTIYYYSVDHFGAGMDQSCYTNAVEELEYAMPFTRTNGTSTADGLLLSSEAYSTPCTLQIPILGRGCTRSCTDSSNAPVLPARSTYVQYEQDNLPSLIPSDQNRRLRRSRTIFNDDAGCGGNCYEETEFSDFDGLGHYRTATHRSNVPGTFPRDTTTHYNARGGTYVPGGGSSPDAYMILPASPWLLGVYDFQTTAENLQTARSEFCFNGTTGFLERRRTWRSGDRTHDLLATFDQSSGNVTAESYFGGDSQPLSGGFSTCTSNPGTPTYRLTHHYTAGSVDSTQYDGVAFKSLDLTIDSNTGLASASRDTSGLLATTYTYDTMQRLTEVRPSGEAWTKYTYTFGTPSSVSVIRRPFGSSSTATAETSNYLYFDAFGRSVLSKEQFPEGWSSSKTVYDVLGRAVSTSMPEFRGSSSWENFTPAHSTSTTFDRFDRPLIITMPDTRSTTFSYTGNRVTARTACVSASDSLAPCPAGERPFTTTETVDGHGRLASVTEPLGNGITTTYGYDVGNRLTSVSTNAPEGVQHRSFTCDLAGFLTSEQHPEKGINGYGTVSYPEYDARGHLRHRVDGTTSGSFDTTFVYDASERLTHVKDLDPSTQNRRDLKVFDYGIDNPTGNPRLGKLQTATRHNYQPTLGGDVAVAETYTYGGPNGRVSARGTSISGALPAITFTLGQTWDDLGNIASITYPTNGAFASTPARTVAYSYTNALLTGISGYTTGMTHLANGILGHIAHANGENEDWNADASGMSRPASIHITSNFGADKLIGPYAYDSAGNIKQVGDAAATHTSYQYDGVGRLAGSIAFTPPSLSNSQTFSYDSFGNKTSIGSVQPHQVDPNGDGIVSVSDVFYLINYLYLSGPPPRGAAGILSGDANGDGLVTVSDIFFLINFLYLGGPAPNFPIEALPSGELTPVNASAADSVTVGTVTATSNTVDVPVYIRDLSGTSLGRDQAAGSKIQSFSIKVGYSPASAVSSVAFSRSGITSSLSPTAAFNPSTIGSISLVDTFQESSNLLPFTLNASASGDLVAHLVFTLNGSASPGSTIAITLDPSLTLLSDEGGNTSESPANGTLALIDGAINIPLHMTTAPIAAVASAPAEAAPTSVKLQRNPKPAIFLNDKSLAAGSSSFAPRFSSSYTGTTNHDAAFAYDEAGDVLHDDTGRSFTYDALSMTTSATAPLPNRGTRTFAYIYTADDERIALVEKLSSGATTTNWTLRGLDNHLLRTWFNSSTSGWSWREDEIWRGGSLLAYESSIGARHYGLDHLGSPTILTDSTGRLIGNISFDAFGNGGANGAGMLQYTGHERDIVNAGLSPAAAPLPDYFHARYYDSSRGRFLSSDPLQGSLHHPQSLNRYTYVANNPLNFTDSAGLCETVPGQEPCTDLAITVTAKSPTWLEHEMTMASIAAITGLRSWGIILSSTLGVFRHQNRMQGQVSRTLNYPCGEPGHNIKCGMVFLGEDTEFSTEGTALEGELEGTLDRIANGESFPHRNDGTIFRNFEGKLPQQPAGYYREYVHPTAGVTGPGPQRVVIGSHGEIYYTPDHYQSFTRIK